MEKGPDGPPLLPHGGLLLQSRSICIRSIARAASNMKHLGSVAIVGVGLIGGSIGLALRQRQLADTVVGIGRRQVGLRIARRVGAVTDTTIHLAKGVAEADLVVVCTPVASIADLVREAAQHCPEGTLITDAGSTKQAIVAGPWTRGSPAAAASWAATPWPAARRPGPTYADADLFEGRVAILTPTRNTRAEDFDLLEEFWQSLGSVVVRMSPEEHDRALARHQPPAARGGRGPGGGRPGAILPPGRHAAFSTPRGWPAATRELWRQILMQNRDNVLAALEQYGTKLSAVHAALRDGNEAEPGTIPHHREEEPRCFGKLTFIRPTASPTCWAGNVAAGGRRTGAGRAT